MAEEMKSADIRNIEAEAAVIASLLINPELYFYSEDLEPNHFTEEANAYIYFALKELAKNYMERYEFRKDKLQVWADEGIPFDVMWNYQIRYDAFDDRIVYPIRNLNGEIFCVSGRTCDPDYKAKGLRKYTYTSPIGALPTMYGFWENREAIMESKEAIVFEGCKSVLKSVSFGYPNAVALLTSHLSPFQLETMIKLASFHSIRFVFALDSDVDLSKDKNIIEMIPAENCAGVICQADNLLFEQDRYFIYSNQWIPLMEKCTIQEKCRLGSLFDKQCGGGCIAHINIENRFPNEETAWEMLNYVASQGVIYFAFTTKISVCAHKHAFISEPHCPVCGEPIADTYARVVGFYTPTGSYQKIRKREFDRRKWMNVLERDGVMQ